MMADLIVEDRDGRPALLVEVEAREASPPALEQLVRQLTSSRPEIPFGMLVDPDQITLITADAEDPFSPLLTIPSGEVFPHYDSEFSGGAALGGSKRIIEFCLSGLVKAWLSDLSSRWKPGEPPHARDVAEIGLLDRITGGTIIEEALVLD